MDIAKELTEDLPFAVFDNDGCLEIQRIDDEAPEGYTDDDAAIEFVRKLEAGHLQVVLMAKELLNQF